MRKFLGFKILVVLLFSVVMTLSGCAYVTMSLTVGSAATMLVGGVMGARKIQKTQDSLKQVVADSLKMEYPTIPSDSLPAMVENAIVSRKIQKTQDSIKHVQDSLSQAVTDSLKINYPTVSSDSLSVMVEKTILEKNEQKKEDSLDNLMGFFLGLAGVVAVVILFVLPLRASPGLGD